MKDKLVVSHEHYVQRHITALRIAESVCLLIFRYFHYVYKQLNFTYVLHL